MSIEGLSDLPGVMEGERTEPDGTPLSADLESCLTFSVHFKSKEWSCKIFNIWEKPNVGTSGAVCIIFATFL